MTPATEAAIRAATRLHIERRLAGLSRAPITPWQRLKRAVTQ